MNTKMIKPYSQNVIFFDTEFSSLDATRGEILSFAMIKFNGEELYLELEFDGVVDPWPRENILPVLTQEKVSREKAVELIVQFVGDEVPYVVAFVNQFDMIYFYRLLGLELANEKFNWIPVDFASILFSRNINPEVLVNWDSGYLDAIGIDITQYNQHNALDDARLLREVYLKTAEMA